MSINTESDERISSYLRGEMSKEEENAFKDDLQTDETLRSQAMAVAYLAKAMRDVGSAQDNDIKEALMSISESDARSITANAVHSTKIKPLVKRVLYAMSAAASIIVLFVVGVQYNGYKSTTRLGDKYGSVFIDENSYSRGDADDADSQSAQELANLYGNVQRGTNLDATIKRLSVLWEISTMENVYSYYTMESPRIGWNLTIAYLKNNDRKAAKDVLNKLISTTGKGDTINRRARELLKEINAKSD